MGRVLLLISACFLSLGAVAGQQPISVPPAPAPAFYYNDGGASLPELLHAEHTFTSHHCKKTEGLLVLGAVVDTNGVPRQLTVIRSAGPELDAAGRAYVSAERFKPGVLNGNPVAVAIEMELPLEGCKQKSVGPDGKEVEEALLAAEAQVVEELPPPLPDPKMTGLQLSKRTSIPGVERVGPGISPPHPVSTPEARFSSVARKFKIQGSCLLQLIVDTNGEPKNIHLVRSIEPSLDEQALKAVAQYRFKPAMKEGQPVPVMITVEVNFRLW